MNHQPALAPNMHILSANLLKATSLFKKNAVISPVPLVESLAFLALSSRGETQESILRILGYASLDALENSFLPILPTEEFFAASSVWLKFSEMPPEYVKNALARSATFCASTVKYTPPSALAQVSLDDYVQRASLGRMGTAQFAKEISKSDMAILDLAGFYDCWDAPIKKIESEIFHGLTSDTSVDMLTAKGGGLIYRGETAAYLRKRYRDSRYSFVAIEPYDFKSFADSFSSKTIEGAIDYLWGDAAQVATVGIPRFSFQSENDLTLALKAFGLTPMFDPTQGVFQEILSATAVSKVCQASAVYVDEFGTKAESQQFAEVKVTSAPKSIAYYEPVILNNPFIYFIYDEELEIPLFVGTMVDFKSSKTLEVSSESLDTVENAPKSEEAKTNNTIKIVGLVILLIVILAFVANPLGIIMIPMLLIVLGILMYVMKFVQIGAAAVNVAKPLIDKAIEKSQADPAAEAAKEAQQADEFYDAGLHFEEQNASTSFATSDFVADKNAVEDGGYDF